MTDYSKTTDFAAKDSLPSGNANKRIRGSEYEAEYNAIQTAVASKADKIAIPVTDNILSMDSTGNLKDSGLAGSDLGSLIDVQVFTSSGTWTKPSGCTKVLVEVLGAGGGSGGANCAAGWVVTGGAGGGGAYAMAWIITGLGSTETVTIGAAGTAGTSTTNGGNGGTSSFGSFVSCPGGTGGAVANYTGGAGTSAGGTGSAPTVTGEDSSVEISGGNGEQGYRINSIAFPGFSSQPGLGHKYSMANQRLVLVSAATAAGILARGNGAGGGGSLIFNGAAGLSGVAGKAGLVIVRAYR